MTQGKETQIKIMSIHPIQELGDDFADAAEPANFPLHMLRYRNVKAANSVDLPQLSESEWIKHFGKFHPLPQNLTTPLAIRYHGHQFRQYNPDIGDGRGFLFAQLRDKTGRLLDLGTKGSGQTPYSRSGDGRLTLKGGVREVLATEMLEASGVYTSKTFSLIETGEDLARSDEPSPARSSVLVRLSHSHIRFGAFQRLAYFNDVPNLEKLIRHVRTYYHDDIPDGDIGTMAPAILERITRETARMVASWMAAGFVHGVMNTDNMNVTGETFDFGPYRFIPTSNPGFTAAYFDQQGLYAFGRQPEAALWNLKQLASSFTLVAGVEPLTNALMAYEPAYQEALRDACFFQLGLQPGALDADLDMLQSMFSWMTDTQIPWAQFFFDWFCGAESRARAASSPVSDHYQRDDFQTLSEALQARTPAAPHRLTHEYFQRSQPETLLIDEIEALWADIAEKDDWTAFEDKIAGIRQKKSALLDEQG